MTPYLVGYGILFAAALLLGLGLCRAASEPVNHGQSGDIDPAATPPPTPTGLPQSLAGGVRVRHSREASLSSLPASSYANGPSALRMPWRGADGPGGGILDDQADLHNVPDSNAEAAGHPVRR